MDFLEELRHNNDIDGAVARLGGNEALYRLICRKLITDTSFSEFEKCISVEDYNSARIPVHTLKGIAVNLGFLELNKQCSQILNSISGGDYGEIAQMKKEFKEEYCRIIKIIGQL